MKSIQLGMHWFPERAGGLDRVYYELCRYLPAAGVSVRGLLAGSGRAAEESGGSIRAFGAADAPLLKRLRAVRQAIQAEVVDSSPDVLAAHFALYAFPALDIVSRHPFVMHFHGPWAREVAAEGGRHWVCRIQAMLERAVYGRADRLIVLSRAFGDILASQYGIDESRIRIVPGGVDAARFDVALDRKGARAQLGWDQDRPTVLVVRRLARRMGLENLIEAARHIVVKIPEVQILIAGKGPLAQELGARIDICGLQRSVKLLGFVSDEDLPLAYRAADLSVVPTVALEGFGLITLESLAAGTPVLVTPVGGLPEAVSGLSSSLVLPGSDVPSLVDGITAALKGEMLLPEASACHAHVLLHHDWSVIAMKTRAVYEEAIG